MPLELTFSRLSTQRAWPKRARSFGMRAIHSARRTRLWRAKVALGSARSRDAEHAVSQLELQRDELKCERRRSHQLEQRLHQLALSSRLSPPASPSRVQATASSSEPLTPSDPDPHGVTSASRAAYLAGVRWPQPPLLERLAASPLFATPPPPPPPPRCGTAVCACVHAPCAATSLLA